MFIYSLPEGYSNSLAAVIAQRGLDYQAILKDIIPSMIDQAFEGGRTTGGQLTEVLGTRVLQKMEDKPYGDSGICHFSKVCRDPMIEGILGKPFQSKRQIIILSIPQAQTWQLAG